MNFYSSLNTICTYAIAFVTFRFQLKLIFLVYQEKRVEMIQMAWRCRHKTLAKPYRLI